MNYSYSVIEYDKSTIKNLQDHLQNFSNYTCVGTSYCYDTSLDLILKYSPDIVFINIDNKKNDNSLNAFNFVNDLYKYVQKLPLIIALSSSTEYAYTCIKNNFFDYLLKPVNSFELRKSTSRLPKKPMEISSKLCLKSYKDYRFIDLNEILFLKADNTSADIFMCDGTTVSAYKTLKFFESILPENFTRIHNSYIVNQNYIFRIHFGKSKCTLKDSTYSIPFSKSYRSNVVLLEKALSKRALISLN